MSNICVISGRISDYGPKLRYLESGKPELSITVLVDEPSRDGRTFVLYVPVTCYGAQCEPLAESLEPNDLVLITGKLAWTKKPTKAGEKASMVVTCFNVEKLAPRRRYCTAGGVGELSCRAFHEPDGSSSIN